MAEDALQECIGESCPQPHTEQVPLVNDVHESHEAGASQSGGELEYVDRASAIMASVYSYADSPVDWASFLNVFGCSWLAEVEQEPFRLRIGISISVPKSPESIFTNGLL